MTISGAVFESGSLTDVGDRASLAPLRHAFERSGYIEVQHLLRPAVIARVRTTAGDALERFGRRRDLLMPATENSPRHYRLASRANLLAVDAAINDIYRAPELLDMLTAITGEIVLPVPYEPEEFIATRFEREGDTHGWHWDDYAFALIWVGVSPNPACGGSLERIPNVPWDKAQPGVAAHLVDRAPEVVHPQAGTVYLLRSDTTMHRVTPLCADVRREVACFSYASAADFSRKITHETIETLAAD